MIFWKSQIRVYPGITGSEMTVRVEVYMCFFICRWLFRWLRSVNTTHFDSMYAWKLKLSINYDIHTLQFSLLPQIRVYPVIPGSEVMISADLRSGYTLVYPDLKFWPEMKSSFLDFFPANHENITPKVREKFQGIIFCLQKISGVHTAHWVTCR